MTIPQFAAALNELVTPNWGCLIVRQFIADILKVELMGQAARAHASGLDARPYQVRVFEEADRPYDHWLNPQEGVGLDPRPLVNVCCDSGSSLPGSSIEVSQSRVQFNCDVYAFATSKASNGGQELADTQAANLTLRAAGVVRNILMSSPFRYLKVDQFPETKGLVGSRTITSFETFSVASDQKLVTGLRGLRLVLSAHLNEKLTQKILADFNTLRVSVRNEINGEVSLPLVEYERAVVPLPESTP